MVVGFTTTYAISTCSHIHCECESRSSEVYLIEHYVIKFVSNLWQVSGFPPPIIHEHDDITEILLKVLFNTAVQHRYKPNPLLNSFVKCMHFNKSCNWVFFNFGEF